MKTSRRFHPRSDRGSLLIVSMLMSAVIALSLSSYLQLTRSSLTISNRALYNNAAMNLAENGLEEAMYSINKKIEDDTYDWSGWTIDGTAAKRKWTGYTFDQNATGIMRVYVYNYTGGGGVPKAVARATITLGGATSRTIEKWVEVQLKKTSKFSNGLVAKNTITFNGNGVTVDSWDSDPDNNGIPDTDYSSGVRNDNGSVGSISVSTGAVGTNNGDVWGYVSTAGDDPSDDVGSSGSILGDDSAANGYTTVDPSRVATDFSASFDPVTAPDKTYYGVPGGTIGDDLELPLTGATRDADGNFYYTADKIDFNNKTLLITDKVVLKLTDTAIAIKMAGASSTISITTGTLDIYSEGDVTCSGNGISNGEDGGDSGTALSDSEAGAPVNFQFWGTKTSGVQNIDINGNGVFAGTIYAPQGDVDITGNGSVSGSVVANNITLTGNAQFHYDESLADDGTGNPYRVSIWKEITDATDRAALDDEFDF